MATITEDYVSFETAKLLKERGFNDIDCECRGWIGRSGKHYSADDTFYDDDELKKAHEDRKDFILLITLQMACKWLRKVHKISIEISSTGFLIDNDANWECDIKVGHRLYYRHITNEKSFESCAEKAIKYCLENLI